MRGIAGRLRVCVNICKFTVDKSIEIFINIKVYSGKDIVEGHVISSPRVNIFVRRARARAPSPPLAGLARQHTFNKVALCTLLTFYLKNFNIC